MDQASAKEERRTERYSRSIAALFNATIYSLNITCLSPAHLFFLLESYFIGITSLPSFLTTGITVAGTLTTAARSFLYAVPVGVGLGSVAAILVYGRRKVEELNFGDDDA